MAMRSRRKGKTGELELAQFLRTRGTNESGRQGGAGSPDVIGLDRWHIECKRCERGSLYDLLDQAIEEAGELLPVVMHRKNKREWVAILSLDAFLELMPKAAT